MYVTMFHICDIHYKHIYIYRYYLKHLYINMCICMCKYMSIYMQGDSRPVVPRDNKGQYALPDMHTASPIAKLLPK